MTARVVTQSSQRRARRSPQEWKHLVAPYDARSTSSEDFRAKHVEALDARLRRAEGKGPRDPDAPIPFVLTELGWRDVS